MASISGYINPFSTEFHKSAEKFPSLSTGSMILAIFFSSIAFLVTLPFLGIGGYAAFRSLVDRLSPINRQHSKTTEKTAKVGEDTLAIPKRRTRIRPQTLRVEKWLASLESQLKTTEEYVRSTKIQEALDKVLASDASISDKEGCLDDLATLYTCHCGVQKSIKTVESMICKEEGEHKENFSKRLIELKSQYEELGTSMQKVFALQQAKIAQIFLLIDSEFQKNISLLQAASETELKKYEKMADFLHEMFTRIKKSPEEQKEIKELQELKPGTWGLSSLVNWAFDLMGLDSKFKVHEAMLDSIKIFQSKVKGEINRRKIEKSKKSLFSRYSAFSSRVDPGGLPNLGNTCFMNSSLQVILNTPSLSALIDRDLFEPVDDHSWRCLEHLKALKVLKEVYEGKNQDITLRDALKKLRNVVIDRETRLVQLPPSYSQQDAGEFLTAVLQGIGYAFILRTTITGEDEEHSIPKDNPQVYISLPMIKKRKGKATFQELVDAFKEERKDDPNNIWNVTNDEGEAIRQYQKYTITHVIVKEIPDTLVVQLKRFDRSKGYSTKISDPIEIGEEVDMRALIDESLLNVDDVPSTRYRVTGVVVHGGTISGGHYTADVKIGDKWESRSDSSVTSNPSEDRIAKNRETGYIYVLERIK